MALLDRFEPNFALKIPIFAHFYPENASFGHLVAFLPSQYPFLTLFSHFYV